MVDNQNDGVKDDEEVKPQEESPTSEETTEEVEETKSEDASEEEAPKAETAESNKGASQRIRELNQQKKEAEAKAAAAEEKIVSLSQHLKDITEPQGAGGNSQEIPQYKPEVKPGEEITPERYQQDLDRTSEARIELRLRQERAINRIQVESEEMVRKYPQLDPENDDFNKELSDAVTEATEAHVRANPYSASPKKFVDRLMKPYLGSVAKEVGKQAENVAKQVSEAALRPTSVRKGEKSAGEKSMAELEAELGIVQA